MKINSDSSGSPLPKLAYNRLEVAELLGVSPPTVDRLTKRGLLVPSRATRRPLYTVEELERFLRETTDRAGSEERGCDHA